MSRRSRPSPSSPWRSRPSSCDTSRQQWYRSFPAWLRGADTGSFDLLDRDRGTLLRAPAARLGTSWAPLTRPGPFRFRTLFASSRSASDVLGSTAGRRQWVTRGWRSCRCPKAFPGRSSRLHREFLRVWLASLWWGWCLGECSLFKSTMYAYCSMKSGCQHLWYYLIHVSRLTYLDISLGKETELVGRCVIPMSVIWFLHTPNMPYWILHLLDVEFHGAGGVSRPWIRKQGKERELKMAAPAAMSVDGWCIYYAPKCLTDRNIRIDKCGRVRMEMTRLMFLYRWFFWCWSGKVVKWTTSTMKWELGCVCLHAGVQVSILGLGAAIVRLFFQTSVSWSLESRPTSRPRSSINIAVESRWLFYSWFYEIAKARAKVAWRWLVAIKVLNVQWMDWSAMCCFWAESGSGRGQARSTFAGPASLGTEWRELCLPACPLTPVNQTHRRCGAQMHCVLSFASPLHSFIDIRYCQLLADTAP